MVGSTCFAFVSTEFLATWRQICWKCCFRAVCCSRVMLVNYQPIRWNGRESNSRESSWPKQIENSHWWRRWKYRKSFLHVWRSAKRQNQLFFGRPVGVEEEEKRFTKSSVIVNVNLSSSICHCAALASDFKVFRIMGRDPRVRQFFVFIVKS